MRVDILSLKALCGTLRGGRNMPYLPVPGGTGVRGSVYCRWVEIIDRTFSVGAYP